MDDAIEILLEDHRETRIAFEKYAKLPRRAYDEKKRFAIEICTDLLKHASVEEEIFYPAVQETNEGSMAAIDEAIMNHDSTHDLIEEILGMRAEDEAFDGKIRMLRAFTENHMQEEENDLFPNVRKLDLDLQGLGERMAALREELEEAEI